MLDYKTILKIAFQVMTPQEKREVMIRAGIIDENGNVTPHFKDVYKYEDSTSKSQ